MKKDHRTGPDFTPAGNCWLCGEPLASPYVEWNGGAESISLHPMCAGRMSFGLAQDAYEVFNGKRLPQGEETEKWLGFFVPEGTCGGPHDPAPEAGAGME